MMVKDSNGMRLYPALTSTRSGANDISFDKNFAVSTPPRFLLDQFHENVNLTDIDYKNEIEKSV